MQRALRTAEQSSGGHKVMQHATCGRNVPCSQRYTGINADPALRCILLFELLKKLRRGLA